MGAVEEWTEVFPALASTKSCFDSFFQVNEDVFKTPEASASDLKVILVSSVSLWLCSVGEETEYVSESVCMGVYMCMYVSVCVGWASECV